LAQRIPLAWKQLTFEPMKIVTATMGVMVAVMLMWVQLGILASVYSSATIVHRGIRADLVILHPQSDTMNQPKPFSVRTLYRVLGNADVQEIGELHVGPVTWRNPANGSQWQIQCYGVDPEQGWLDIKGIDNGSIALRQNDTFIYDRRSRNVFGPVLAAFDRGEVVEVELNRRRCKIVGTTELAASFGQMGNVVMSRENFLRLHAGQSADEVHVGLVRVRSEANLQAVKQSLANNLASEAIVMTAAEFIEFELRYWKTNAPVGFIFTMGTIVGFFIGFIVVYQILYTDVTNHLPHFATMKAIGFSDGFLLQLVIRQAIILSVLGYVPGSLLAIGVYKAMNLATGIPVYATWERAGLLLLVTSLMCLMSGAMATRRLRSADPADVF
jgi:putative ABC transport system permease protein